MNEKQHRPIGITYLSVHTVLTINALDSDDSVLSIHWLKFEDSPQNQMEQLYRLIN